MWAYYDEQMAFRVELASMKRCDGLDSWTCNTDADCPNVCSNDGNKICTLDTQCPGGLCNIVTTPCEELGTGQVLGWLSWPPDQNNVARLVDEPQFSLAWPTTVHVADCEIVPVATYAIGYTTNQDTPYPIAGWSFKDIGTITKPGVSHYGDIVGPFLANGWTRPDGFANVNDLQAVIHAAEGASTAPHMTRADVVGLDAGAAPDYDAGIEDVHRITLGIEGQTYTAADGQVDPWDCASASARAPSGPTVTFSPVPNVGLVSSTYPVEVDVFIDAVSALSSYQVALEVTGGTAGTLDLIDIVVRSAHPDYVFASESGVSTVMNLALGRVGSTIGSETVSVSSSAYVATFIYQPSGGAEGIFSVTVKGGDDDLIITDAVGARLTTAPASTQLIGIGVDCLLDLHCDDNNACTTDTCTSGACFYQDTAQGTSCDDGLFCTATDECDGNGACVGAGNRCGFGQWCCEDRSQCICRLCLCGRL
jgi:hypothetical protein